LAVADQREFGIPASITLAQGLHESGAGQSELAVKANNHFGIKCNGWDGAKSYHDDDRPNECFRKYNSVEESFADHSAFLKNRERYASLFKLNKADYKGWARGLQQAGYATDKAYANRLIKIIEDYELYIYDKEDTRHKTLDNGQATDGGERYAEKRRQKTNEGRKDAVITIPVIREHGLEYVTVRQGDTPASIAEATAHKLADILKYNEIPEDFPFQPGDRVYLKKKKSKSDKPYYDHVVRIGESMHGIAQMYGVRLKSLYKLNRKSDDYIPTEGDVLKLR
jgi:LysM repeat protein